MRRIALMSLVAACSAPVAFASEKAAESGTKSGGSFETLIVLGVIAGLGYVLYRAGIIGGGGTTGH